MITRRMRLAFVSALLVTLVSVAGAQSCLVSDDGFQVGCCNPVTSLTLPTFPAVTLMADYGALTSCQKQFTIPPFPVSLGAPLFVVCDVALIPISIALAPGHTISGTLLAKYSRTWIDMTSPVAGQVWRFLVNGDLTCTAAGGIGVCTTIFPRCASTGLPVHFDGHIDYYCDFSSGAINLNASISLNHHQGCLSHAFWSAVPLVGAADHTEVSYHIVGPAPFNFAPVPAPQGPIVSDAVRATLVRLTSPAYVCYGEGPIPNIVGAGFLGTVGLPHCSCASSIFDQCTGAALPCLAPTQCFEDQAIQGVTCCQGFLPPFQSLPFPGTPMAATGLIAQNLGSFGGGFSYPGTASLTSYFGVLTYTDPCAVANWPIHLVTGVGVHGPFGQPYQNTTSCTPNIGFATVFMDLQNTLLLSNPLLPPGYGSASVPDIVWNLSM